MPPIPSGTVTFLFTDIEGSTRLWESAPEAMRQALERHDTLLRLAIEAHGGYVFATGGDGFAVAFASAGEALGAAMAMQTTLADEPWPTDATLRVRMGVHTGEATERDGDYFGPAVNRTARLMAVAHGGQVVCSQPTAALAHNEPAPLQNLGEHRLRDLAAPETVFQVGAGVHPPLRSVDAVPTNLPTVRTQLIGRSDDVTALVGLVERERLITLTGPGGVGKTRLALGVAASLAADFADGCWLVELAPIADGDEVSNAVAAAMRAPTTSPDALAAYLADRRMLIVLDNCEHLVDPAADLVDRIIATAPDVHVIVTSRESLGLDGEQVRRVPSLAVPDPDAGIDVAVMSPAVRLFAERAAAVNHGFEVDRANVADVVEICRQLDGIPLAIELAAARVRAMAPAEIARRLDERFRLLAGGSRRSQERHRTLLATVAWSHDLLTDDERAVFRRLAVFPATFDLAAAESVAGDDDVDAVDCVLRLVDRSLVAYEAGQDRYRLLETLRQFGADRLADAGESEDRRARHAAHFLAVVERLQPEWLDARYPTARATALAEADNLRTTADWCIEAGHWSELAAMCDSLWYFLIQDATTDSASWHQQLLDHADMLDDQVVVDALGSYAWLQVSGLGNFTASVELADRSHDLSARSGARPSAVAWNAKAMAALYEGRFEEALGCSETGLRLAHERIDVDQAVTALCNQMVLLGIVGESERSAAAAADALSLAEESGQPVLIGAATISMCAVYLTARSDPDFQASAEILGRRELPPESGDLNDGWYEVMAGMTLLGLGKPDAVTHLAKAVRLADRVKSGHALEQALRLLAIAAAEAGLTTHALLVADYVDQELRHHRIDSPGQVWIQTRLDSALRDASHHPINHAQNRAQIMNLVTEIEDAVSAVVS